MLSFNKLIEDYEAIKRFNLIGKDRPKTLQDMKNAFRIMKSQGAIREIGSGYFSIAFSGWEGGPYILKYHNVMNHNNNEDKNFDGYIEWAKYVVANQDNNPHLSKIYAFQPLYEFEESEGPTVGYYTITEKLDITSSGATLEKYVPENYFIETMSRYSPKIIWKEGEEPFDLFSAILEYDPSFQNNTILDYAVAKFAGKYEPLDFNEVDNADTELHLFYKFFLDSLYSTISSGRSDKSNSKPSAIKEYIKELINILTDEIADLLNLYNHYIEYEDGDPDDITNVGPPKRVTLEGFLEFIFTKSEKHKPKVLKYISEIAKATAMLVMSESLTTPKFFEALEFIRQVNIGEHDRRVSADLHAGNFGFRPSDGQFVIMDPFAFISTDGFVPIPGGSKTLKYGDNDNNVYNIADVEKLLAKRFPEEQ